MQCDYIGPVKLRKTVESWYGEIAHEYNRTNPTIIVSSVQNDSFSSGQSHQAKEQKWLAQQLTNIESNFKRARTQGVNSDSAQKGKFLLREISNRPGWKSEHDAQAFYVTYADTIYLDPFAVVSNYLAGGPNNTSHGQYSALGHLKHEMVHFDTGDLPFYKDMRAKIDGAFTLIMLKNSIVDGSEMSSEPFYTGKKLEKLKENFCVRYSQDPTPDHVIDQLNNAGQSMKNHNSLSGSLRIEMAEEALAYNVEEDVDGYNIYILKQGLEDAELSIARSLFFHFESQLKHTSIRDTLKTLRSAIDQTYIHKTTIESILL